MENNNIKNIQVTHRGFFWLVWKLISFPFTILWKLIKWISKYVRIYLSWYKESQKVEKRKKEINKYFKLIKDEEVL